MIENSPVHILASTCIRVHFCACTVVHDVCVCDIYLTFAHQVVSVEYIIWLEPPFISLYNNEENKITIAQTFVAWSSYLYCSNMQTSASCTLYQELWWKFCIYCSYYAYIIPIFIFY